MTASLPVIDKPKFFGKAKCKGYPPALFFPSGNARGRVPKNLAGINKVASRDPYLRRDRMEQEEYIGHEVCLGRSDGVVCPIVAECLAYALASGDIGVWGGTSTETRAELRGKKYCNR